MIGDDLSLEVLIYGSTWPCLFAVIEMFGT